MSLFCGFEGVDFDSPRIFAFLGNGDSDCDIDSGVFMVSGFFIGLNCYYFG